MPIIDYRHDPFLDTGQAVDVTDEIHMIPLNSPYSIRLREIPRRDTPSTLTVRVTSWLTAPITTAGQASITVANGAWFAVNDIILVDSEQMQVIEVADNTLTVSRGYGGTTATTHTICTLVYILASMEEVAATPNAKQFWPDYGTEADGDKDWNTGTILFNPADAGKLVSVNYKGTGTLLDHRLSAETFDCSPLLCNFGNGSEGDFISTGDFSLGGLHQYRNFFLNAGHTLTSNEPITVIRCTGLCIIDGIISTVGQGSAGGTQTPGGASPTNPGMPGTGGGEGGGPRASAVDSGIFGYAGIMVAAGGSTPNATMQDIMLRSGLAATMVGGGGASGAPGSSQGQNGGAGGKGAGALVIIAKSIKFTGTINANGSNGASGWRQGCGGGGGTVILGAMNWLADTGIINVAGGTGYYAGGAGWYRKLRL